MGCFYLAVIQAILLYGSETWVISKRMLKRLESFHHRCARSMAHRPIRRLADGSWEHPHSSEVLTQCGLLPIHTYIARRKRTLLRYARTECALYDMCLHSIPLDTVSHRQVWWQ